MPQFNKSKAIIFCFHLNGIFGFLICCLLDNMNIHRQERLVSPLFASTKSAKIPVSKMCITGRSSETSFEGKRVYFIFKNIVFVYTCTIGLHVSEKFSTGMKKNPNKQTNTIGPYLQMMIGIIRVIYILISMFYSPILIYSIIKYFSCVLLYFISYNLGAISLFVVNVKFGQQNYSEINANFTAAKRLTRTSVSENNVLQRMGTPFRYRWEAAYAICKYFLQLTMNKHLKLG